MRNDIKKRGYTVENRTDQEGLVAVAVVVDQ